MKFEVLREHIGDKFYKTGDTRDADEISVKHLIRNGVLRPLVDKDHSGTNSDQTQENVEPVGGGTAPTGPEPPAAESQPVTVSPDDVQKAAPAAEAAKEAVDPKATLEALDEQKAENPTDLNKAQGAAPKNKAK